MRHGMVVRFAPPMQNLLGCCCNRFDRLPRSRPRATAARCTGGPRAAGRSGTRPTTIPAIPGMEQAAADAAGTAVRRPAARHRDPAPPRSGGWHRLLPVSADRGGAFGGDRYRIRPVWFQQHRLHQLHGERATPGGSQIVSPSSVLRPLRATEPRSRPQPPDLFRLTERSALFRVALLERCPMSKKRHPTTRGKRQTGKPPGGPMSPGKGPVEKDQKPGN